MEDKRISVGKHGGISDNFSIGIKSPATEKTTIGNNATAAHNKRGLMNKGSSQIIRVQPLESSLNSNGNGAADIAPKLPPKPVREQAHVLFSYDAQNEDELTIKEGEIITIISKENEDAGWWKGELNGRIALFPDNFVKIIKPSVPPPLPPVDSDKVRIKKPDRAVDSTVSPTSSMTGSSSPSVVSHLLGKKSKYPSLNTTTTINNSNNIAQSNNTPTAQSSAASSSNGPSSKLNDSGSDNLLTNDEPKSPSLKDEQNNLFSAELHSPSKLVHLTALRPKIPVNSRRPPSLCIPKEFGDPFENGIGGDFSEPDSPQSEVETSSVPSSSAYVRVRPTPAASNRTDPTTTTQSTTTNNSNTSSPAKAPWVMELKKAQERRKGGGTNDKNNSDANNTNPDVLPPSPSIKPLAPSLPGAKPLVSKSNKPGLSQQTPNEPGEQPQPGMVGIKSVVTPGGRQSAKISSSQQHSTPTQSTQNVSGVAIPSQSNTSIVTSTSNGPISSSVTFSSAGDSNSPLLISNINNKASSSSSSSNATNDEVAKLRKEMAEMRKEWSQEKAELSSQITELKELIESHKKYLPGVVKELINELAEEKKKTANILIELDRLRKLNTTV